MIKNYTKNIVAIAKEDYGIVFKTINDYYKHDLKLLYFKYNFMSYPV